MSKPLPKSQQELLDAMQTGVVIHYSPYMGSWNPKAYYWRADNFKRVTAAALALIEKGRAAKVGKYNDVKLCLVSPQGAADSDGGVA